jgi:hypothetical protein
VIQQLPQTVKSNRLFSFRNDFPDAWYDLHNPELQRPAKRMVVSVLTQAQDFPPNQSDLSILQLMLYFVPADGMAAEIGASLKFTPKGAAAAVGGAATTISDMISTQRGNAGAWTPILGLSPIGSWELNLQTGNPDQDKTVVGWFKNNMILDLMMIVSYSGRLPDWPQ